MSRATRPDQIQSIELTPVISQRFACGLNHLLMTVGVVAFFLFHSYVPLASTGVWGDVNYGNWMLDHGTVPTQAPFLGLAEGVNVVDSTWLGEVILATVERAGGTEALSHLFAVTVVATFLILAGVFYRKTARGGLALCGALMVWLIAWGPLAGLRAGTFGYLCFAILLWLTLAIDRCEKQSRDGWSRPTWPSAMLTWLGVPLLFAIWANLDGSFLCGLALLACCTIGRVADVWWSSGNVVAVLKDRPLRRRVLLLELAVVATLLNPYGVELLFHLLKLTGVSVVNALPIWSPLELTSAAGMSIAASWVLLLVVYRHSRVRVQPVEVLLLAVFSLAVVCRVELAGYYAAVVIFALMPHLADVTDRLSRTGLLSRIQLRTRSLPGRSFRYTLLMGLLVWLAFAFSPVSQPFLGGRERTPERLYVSTTPLGLTRYLQEHPPVGQVANPRWWGDWLLHHGPSGMQLMVTDRAVDAIPRTVWNDYLAITNGHLGFESKLDRYRVNTLVVDKEHQPALLSAVRRLGEWQIVFEDDLGLVAVREGSLQPVETDLKHPTETTAPSSNRQASL